MTVPATDPNGVFLMLHVPVVPQNDMLCWLVNLISKIFSNSAEFRCAYGCLVISVLVH